MVTLPTSGPMAAAVAGRLAPPEQGLIGLVQDGVLDLSLEYAGDPLPENVMAAVEDSLDRGETHYTTRPGLPALAHAVAQKLEGEQGLNLDPSLGVIISTGARESLFVAVQVLAQPGDEVLVPALRPAHIDEDIRLAQGCLLRLSRCFQRRPAGGGALLPPAKGGPGLDLPRYSFWRVWQSVLAHFFPGSQRAASDGPEAHAEYLESALARVKRRFTRRRQR